MKGRICRIFLTKQKTKYRLTEKKSCLIDTYGLLLMAVSAESGSYSISYFLFFAVLTVLLGQEVCTAEQERRGPV